MVEREIKQPPSERRQPYYTIRSQKLLGPSRGRRWIWNVETCHWEPCAHPPSAEPLKQKQNPSVSVAAVTHAQLTTRPMFCRARFRSRSRTRSTSVTITNGAGDGGQKVSPILLRSRPLSRLGRLCAFAMEMHFWRQDPVPVRGYKPTASDPSGWVLA
jgi:hypothetical protein